MQETIFSKIIAREIPSDIVYENEQVIAFLDIKPIHPGGTLVVPKTWSRNIFDIDPTSWCAVMEVARLLAPAIKDATGATGINIVMNNEPDAGQVIFHSHVHLIPRHKHGAGISGEGKEYISGEQTKMANTIRACIEQHKNK